MLSKAGRAKLDLWLATNVASFIRDGLKAWAQAGEGAVSDAADPDDADSNLYWLISLAGNLLWAATVFFPPAGAIAAATVAGKAAAAAGGASLATKAASLLGATLGSDTVKKLTKEPPSTDAAKSFLRDVLAAKQDELNAMFAAAADNWIKQQLGLYVYGQLVGAIEDREWEQHHRTQIFQEELYELLTDDVAQDYMSKVANINEIYLYTVKNFLFPGVDFAGSQLNLTLRKFMVTEMSQALKEFNQQFSDWKKARSAAAPMVIAGRGIGAGTYAADSMLKKRAEFEQKNPFRPHLTFMGLPKSVQQSNGTDVGDIVVTWKYKS
jgi:hypothetical protein